MLRPKAPEIRESNIGRGNSFEFYFLSVVQEEIHKQQSMISLLLSPHSEPVSKTIQVSARIIIAISRYRYASITLVDLLVYEPCHIFV